MGCVIFFYFKNLVEIIEYGELEKLFKVLDSLLCKSYKIGEKNWIREKFKLNLIFFFWICEYRENSYILMFVLLID